MLQHIAYHTSVVPDLTHHHQPVSSPTSCEGSSSGPPSYSEIFTISSPDYSTTQHPNNPNVILTPPGGATTTKEFVEVHNEIAASKPSTSAIIPNETTSRGRNLSQIDESDIQVKRRRPSRDKLTKQLSSPSPPNKPLAHISNVARRTLSNPDSSKRRSFILESLDLQEGHEDDSVYTEERVQRFMAGDSSIVHGLTSYFESLSTKTERGRAATML